MIVTKVDTKYIIISTNDNNFETVKLLNKNAKIVDISESEYEELKEDITALQELINARIN